MVNIFKRRSQQAAGTSPGSSRKRLHRNPRGLFLGAVVGGIAGYFAGRAVGSAGYGIIFGALIGSALLYRLNPGPWNHN